MKASHPVVDCTKGTGRVHIRLVHKGKPVPWEGLTPLKGQVKTSLPNIQHYRQGDFLEIGLQMRGGEERKGKRALKEDGP